MLASLTTYTRDNRGQVICGPTSRTYYSCSTQYSYHSTSTSSRSTRTSTYSGKACSSLEGHSRHQPTLIVRPLDSMRPLPTSISVVVRIVMYICTHCGCPCSLCSHCIVHKTFELSALDLCLELVLSLNPCK